MCTGCREKREEKERKISEKERSARGELAPVGWRVKLDTPARSSLSRILDKHFSCRSTDSLAINQLVRQTGPASCNFQEEEEERSKKKKPKAAAATSSFLFFFLRLALAGSPETRLRTQSARFVSMQAAHCLSCIFFFVFFSRLEALVFVSLALSFSLPLVQRQPSNLYCFPPSHCSSSSLSFASLLFSSSFSLLFPIQSHYADPQIELEI